MNTGDLRWRVPIMGKDTNLDEEGVVTPVYTPIGSAWVKITPIGGEIAQKKYGIVEDNITLQMVSRPNANIKEMNLVEWNGKLYEIKYVASFIDRYESLLRPAVTA